MMLVMNAQVSTLQGRPGYPMLPPWPVAAEVPVEDESMENPKRRLNDRVDHPRTNVSGQ